MVAEDSFPHTVGSPGALGPRQNTSEPWGFRCGGQGEAEDTCPIALAKSANPPGEAGGGTSSEFATPKGRGSLLGLGDVWTLLSLWACACMWEIAFLEPACTHRHAASPTPTLKPQ